MIFKDILYCGEDYTVRRGCVAVRDGRVFSITDVMPAGGFGEVIDGKNRLLLPGFVNTHCHVPMTLLRGYGENLPLQRWLEERVFPFEALLTDEDVYWGSLLGIAEMLATGTTSFTDMYDHVEYIARAVELSGIKANLSRGIVSFDGSPLFGTAKHEESAALVDKWNNAAGGRIIAEAAVHAEYTSNDTVVRQQGDFARSRGIGIHIHLSETMKEHEDCVRNRGVTPARYFEECGLFENNRVTAAHCVFVTDGDMEIMRNNNVTAVHCPASNLKLGSGVAPVPEMLESGVRVALGTDGASSNNNLNMLEEAHIAALLHRGVKRDAALLPADTIMQIAARSGAVAQGRPDCGLIKEGFRADFAVINLDKPHLTPVHDMISSALFAAQGSDVEMTVADGEILYRNGEFLKFDIREVMKNAESAAKRIAGELA